MNNHEQEKIEYIKKSFELKHQKRYKESIVIWRDYVGRGQYGGSRF